MMFREVTPPLTSEPMAETVGDLIARARQAQKGYRRQRRGKNGPTGMTQGQLAEKAGVSRSWVAAVELAPPGHKPERERLRRVADVLGLDYNQLLVMSGQADVVAEERQRKTDSQPTGDLSALVDAQHRVAAALEAQTRAINGLLAYLQGQTTVAPEWATSLASEVVDTVLGAGQLASTRRASAGLGRSDTPLSGQE